MFLPSRKRSEEMRHVEDIKNIKQKGVRRQKKAKYSDIRKWSATVDHTPPT